MGGGLMKNKHFEILKSIINDILPLRIGTRFFENPEQRYKLWESISKIVTNEKDFDELVFYLKTEYKDEELKPEVLFETIFPQELAAIVFLSLPFNLIHDDCAHSFHCFGDSCVGKTASFNYLFSGIYAHFLTYLYLVNTLENKQKSLNILKGWVDIVLSKAEDILDIKINKDKYTEILSLVLENKLKEIPPMPLYETVQPPYYIRSIATPELYNFFIYVISELNREPFLPFVIFEDDTAGICYDEKTYRLLLTMFFHYKVVNTLAINSCLDLVVIERLKKFYLLPDSIFSRLGLVYHVVGSPDDYSKYKQYDFSDIENIGRKFAIENTNILLLDLALRDLMGDDTVKPIIEGMKTSLGEENADRFQSAFKTLKNHLSYMLQIAYRDKFPKTHRPTFSTTPLFYEYEDKTGQKKYLISPQTRREMISDFINKLWGILENPKSREAIINRALNGINVSLVLDVLGKFYENPERYKEFTSAINTLKEFHINLGSIYGDKFSGIVDKNKIGKAVISENRKKSFMKYASNFNNGEIRKNIETISIDPELAGKKRIDEIWKFMRDNAKKLTSHESIKNAFETTKKNFESGSTKKEDYMRVYDKVVKPFKEAGQSGLKVNEFLAKSFENIASEKGFNEARAYEIIRNMNRVRMCRLKGDTVKVEERANRFINVFNSVVTALKEFIPDPDDYKKVATMFTLATFGLNPLSKHILKQIGVMENEK